MCKLDGTKCDTCYEVVVHTDSGVKLRFVYDEDEADNDVLRTWFFATEFVDSIDVRKVGDTVWSNISVREWQDGQA